MPDQLEAGAVIGAIRCECDGEMHPRDGRDDHDRGVDVECGQCGSVGGVNLVTMDTFGAVERLEIVGR